VLEEFLLGDHLLAMCQEVGEHLKHLAPELDGLPGVLQLMTLGIKHIVAKHVVHRYSRLPHLGALLALGHPVRGHAPQVPPTLS
jgi:hypothetical protein